MNATRRRVIPVSVATIALVFAAADPPAKSTPLFDGKTLDGWTRTGFPGAGEVAVSEGTILERFFVDRDG